MEIVEEDKMNFGRPMTLISKTNAKEDESEEEEEEKADVEGFSLNFEDEVVAYYSNNMVKGSTRIR